jgi:hypothetical protein
MVVVPMQQPGQPNPLTTDCTRGRNMEGDQTMVLLVVANASLPDDKGSWSW